ncbi:Wzz/FepE/Etk N-terminal domain-containing protein [Mucilaginibacter sp. SMC90]|uniref:Wzz/FepE/Etk N-terminal domain-containing protein n=1 Tax=Mucilaginibacter sp. SMC90 TaxID=2929803 RepID=UPI001FB2BC1B|nr:Wzz/FepE/Etk N-terminal domain-containing protein [Mucilaginibacter sp. SMC90]UOE46253.1 Wzz/FepE/Etk N-terminal domain-containing protein [Mucilaginibacter sp. SMC90]
MDKTIDSTEISIKEIVVKIRKGLRYIVLRWKLIIAFGIIGGALGLTYALIKKTTYKAISTFVLEDGSKSAALGQYAGLASLAGIDLNGGGGGIFQGDNIIELYKSRLMLEKTLLSEVTMVGKKQLLIDRYIEFNKLRKVWKQNDHIDTISFIGSADKFTRLQDSIISTIVDVFNKKLLAVSKLDKKLNIIVVQVESEDELFSKAFNLKLVETVNNFYSVTKTKKSNQNVVILQRQADSVKAVLNSSINGVASAIDANPNANPQLLILKVPSQRKQVDVQASTAIYAEITKNLELSKISLRQDIPLIQIIDEPVLPLPKNKVGKLKGIILGGLLGGFLSISFILTKKTFKNLLA